MSYFITSEVFVNFFLNRQFCLKCKRSEWYQSIIKTYYFHVSNTGHSLAGGMFSEWNNNTIFTITLTVHNGMNP